VIECRVLGPLEVRLDGSPPPPELLWRKHVALLIYLALSPARARPRDHLVALLWGEKPDSAARHSLNEALRLFRRSLGAEGVSGHGDLISLDPSLVALDSDLLEIRLHSGDAIAAAELVRGEFMEGFSVADAWEFDEWLAAERRVWRERCVRALVEAAQMQASRGMTRAAAELADRALRLDPLAEAALRARMMACALAGDRTGGLAAYAQWTGRVGSEYGLTPSPETESLAERIRNEKVWPAPSVSEAGQAIRRAWSLIGREAQLETVLREWSGCKREGRLHIAVITGAPGMGRTRLGEEVLARARLDGARTATLRAVPGDRDSAGSGLRALFLTGLIPDGATDQRANAIEGEEPIAHRQRTSPAPLPDTLGAAPAALSALAAGEPTALFLDDAQWLDRESALALHTLTRDLRARPLFIILSVAAPSVAPEIDTLRTRVGGDVPGVSVHLEPLPDAAVRVLAREILPGYSPEELDRITRRVQADCAGVPFLVTAVLGAVAVGLELNPPSAAWPAASRTLEHTLPARLPDPAVAAIRVEFRRLSDAAQKVLIAAAVLNDRADSDLLVRATGMLAHEVTSALDELEWKRWLASEARGYTFVSRLVREVVAGDMTTSGQRRRLLESSRSAGQPPT
jgi:DNA-binding SARP family transcriptional activator